MLLLCFVALPVRAQDGPILRTEFEETQAIPGQSLSLRLTVLVPIYMPAAPVWPAMEVPNVRASDL